MLPCGLTQAEQLKSIKGRRNMIRKQNIILVALTVVLTAGLVHADVHANASLEQRIHHEIAMIPNTSIWDWLQADVHADGTVVLSGEVRRPSIKDDAEFRVRHLEGVTTVKDDIR